MSVAFLSPEEIISYATKPWYRWLWLNEFRTRQPGLFLTATELADHTVRQGEKLRVFRDTVAPERSIEALQDVNYVDALTQFTQLAQWLAGLWAGEDEVWRESSENVAATQMWAYRVRGTGDASVRALETLAQETTGTPLGTDVPRGDPSTKQAGNVVVLAGLGAAAFGAVRGDAKVLTVGVLLAGVGQWASTQGSHFSLINPNVSLLPGPTT